MSALPRISFGMIVLNGEPFLRHNLRALYPFAHEIIVVEGAAPGASKIATAAGHSLDATLATLRQFKAQEDPDDKLLIVTRDGFWSEKEAMSQAYAERASGDYLWQVDVDEFYLPEAMRAICQRLGQEPAITAMSFQTVTFWGGLGYIVDGWNHRRGAGEYHRLFKWGAGYRYASHRPPTVVDERGRDLRSLRWVRGDALQRSGIRLYHYALLLPKQVREKCEYYSRAEWARRRDAVAWAEEAYMRLRRPYHAHNVAHLPACLYRFQGAHPPEVERMWRRIAAPGAGVEIRQSDDIEALLNSRRYKIGRYLAMAADQPSLRMKRASTRLKRLIAGLLPRWLKDALNRQ